MRHHAQTLLYLGSVRRIWSGAARILTTPAATPENPRPRPTMVRDTFRLLIYGG
jgi:hypothetical protein